MAYCIAMNLDPIWTMFFRVLNIPVMHHDPSRHLNSALSVPAAHLGVVILLPSDCATYHGILNSTSPLVIQVYFAQQLYVAASRAISAHTSTKLKVA
jgi:hypothetical protein